MKQFLLLRNNKESGPFSAGQLIESGLRPYDLVWEEGRSAAWRYPSEVAELKAFAPAVEEQPFDRFFKQKERIKTVAADIPTKKEKPRIRIKADCKKIEQPALVAETNQTAQPVFAENAAEPKQPSWSDAWLDWEQEKKAATIIDKKADSSTPYINPKSDVPLETKFSQSLDDIKERYVESILKQREKKPLAIGALFQSKYAAAVVLFLLIGWGLYAGFFMKDNDVKSTAAAAKPAQTVVVPAEVADAPQPANDEAVNTEDNKDEKPVSTNKNELPKPAEKKITAPATPQHTMAHNAAPIIANTKKAFSQNIVLKNKILPPPVVYRQGGHSAVVQQSDGQYVRTVARRADNNGAQSQALANAPASNVGYTTPPSYQKTIADYVTVSNENATSGTVQNVHLSVQNNTDAPIELAVLDVQYYDANGRFQKGETISVNNIPPNDNVDIKVPDSRNSNHINYKVSLVSAGQKTLVAD